MAVYPGSFDPVTYGHMDILRRASLLFDRVLAAVSDNPQKNHTFPLPARIEMLEESLRELRLPKNKIRVESFSGLLVDYLKEKKTPILLRGLRVFSDFEYEFQMALMNRHLDPQVETVFLMPDASHIHLSSTLVKEIVSLGGEVRDLVPRCVLRHLKSAPAPNIP